MGATSNEADTSVRHGGSDEVTVLLDPGLVIGLVDLEVLGEREHDGRSTLMVRAIPREAPERARISHYLEEADDFELLVDAERGVILRKEARFGDAPFRVDDLRDVRFDEEIIDRVFVFHPPPGETIRSTRDVWSPPQGMSLEEAARTAPFVVLAPERLPEGWEMQVQYSPGQERPPASPTVFIMMGDPNRLHGLRIIQSAELFDDSLPWEEVEIDGEQYLVYQSSGLVGGECEVKLERHGTRARLTGNIERQTVLQIARALQPAAPELPPLVER